MDVSPLLQHLLVSIHSFTKSVIHSPNRHIAEHILWVKYWLGRWDNRDSEQVSVYFNSGSLKQDEGGSDHFGLMGNISTMCRRFWKHTYTHELQHEFRSRNKNDLAYATGIRDEKSEQLRQQSSFPLAEPTANSLEQRPEWGLLLQPTWPFLTTRCIHPSFCEWIL